MTAIEAPRLVHGEGLCSDCGNPAQPRSRWIDPHTHSEVELCTTCAPAFLQRLQVPTGCCG